MPIGSVLYSKEGNTLMADWYPKSIPALIPWHANFSTQASATGTSHGLTTSQVQQIGSDNAVVASCIPYVEGVEAFAQAVTEWRNLLLSGPNGTALPPVPTVPTTFVYPPGPPPALPSIEFRTRQYAALIRSSVGYTAEIGEQYGIIAPAEGLPSTPSLQAFALSGSQVRLAIAKGGYEVLAVDSRRGGGSWEQIGVSMTAEYIDARAPLVAGQPEVREYRCQGMSNNARVGDVSPVVSAVTTP
ncbi:MAG: hypothetical protein DCC46_10110 [Armatimonadetes bacterium]|nr:MAG: hypothetical protein DCC46_10110 [Armatimonadota bacterium]